ncbi:hypothetical protein O181_040447 [Austropuccinia psidii MF-1]|uniref:Potassium channel domain-containing protein n=1 Tax=Austropuccinia psidii MF-1 TaxID=1389203 RepID=A0A9Q3DIT7_9BASI|nr:hypothetical protein [Austropuccinia psidii MF-1]
MGGAIIAWGVSLISDSSKQSSDVHDDRENEEGQSKSPTRLAPLFAGLGCPFCCLLELPAVTQPSSTIAYASAFWRFGSLASLALGLIANASLICRYFEYRPQRSTLTAIVILTLHDILNVSILIFFAIKASRLPHVAQVFPSTGWMSLASTFVSSLCNITLFIDYFVVDNFRAKGSGLTTKQRTMVILSMGLLLYIGLGATIFSWLEREKLDFSDALYFCVCTVTTVGFGDIIPTRVVSRIFNFFYAIGGIILLALTVSTMRDNIFEVFESFYRSRRRVMVQRARDRRMHRALTKNSNLPLQPNITRTLDQELGGRPTSDFKVGSFWRRAWEKGRTLRIGSKSNTANDVPINAYKNFERKVLREELKELRTRLIIAGTLFACFWVAGGIIFKFTEKWTYAEAFYFGYVAFLTLGYGDFTVRHPGGRAVFIAWALLGIGNMTLLLTVLTQVWELKYKRAISKSHHKKIHCKETSTQQLNLAASKDNEEFYEHNENSNLNIHDIPDLLVQAAEDFTKHSHFWMHGKSGEPPAGLLELLKEIEGVEDIDRITGKRGLVEHVASSQRRRELFLVSFAKSFDTLRQHASLVKRTMESQQEEIENLKKSIKDREPNNLATPQVSSPIEIAV